MKEIGELDLPGDLHYSEDHEWARQEGDVVRIGITDYAQDQLGDITYVELPEVGDVFEEDKEFGTLESTKAASEMLLPIAGEAACLFAALCSVLCVRQRRAVPPVHLLPGPVLQ